ncbi:hypothetical protein SAMN02745120_2295 [Acetoanaerobium noterae]|uniref:Uncharacterized protein n=1 Tax=Acetoanaerobium noterae TaxID=745369 RepID=A0A1T5CND2_9FIRM|nr:hypothetical protein [Acetoanaerobium noterae]SKB60947.1 hypothetical protein SAMN02745120_2295 [Acetoanaerobium noterae]
MIEPIVFDIVLSTTELTELWQTASVYGSLICLSAFSTGFIINACFGYMHSIRFR